MVIRRTAAFACGLAACALALFTVPARAGLPTAPGPETAPVPGLDPAATVVEAMQRDLGLTAEQAAARLANESRAAEIEARLRARLGGAFAGAWVTGDTAEHLMVATTDAGQAGVIRAEGAHPVIVHRSLAELTAAKRALDRAAADRAPAATPLWYVDVRRNLVTVHAADPARAEAFVARSGADPRAVRVVRSGERPRPLIGERPLPLRYDLRGGDPFYLGGGSIRCSVGFSVRRGGTSGFVTAGHCATAGATTTGPNRVRQGTFQGWSFPGDDHAWVAVNENWVARPWVVTGTGLLTVRGSRPALVGAAVCRAGATSGWRCGTIRQLGVSVHYSQGTVHELIRTDICAEPGDSGGPVVAGNQAQGVLSGGSGDCVRGGTSYIQPVNEILSAYGLTLVTG